VAPSGPAPKALCRNAANTSSGIRDRDRDSHFQFYVQLAENNANIVVRGAETERASDKLYAGGPEGIHAFSVPQNIDGSITLPGLAHRIPGCKGFQVGFLEFGRFQTGFQRF